MKLKINFFIAAFLLVTAFHADGSHFVPLTSGDGTIAMLYPPDKTVMEFGPISISLKIKPASIDRILVRVNREERKEIIPDSEHECFSLDLETGINSIEVHAIKESGEKSEIVLSVFRRSDLEVKDSKPPSGYSKNLFHMREYPLCKNCHDLTPSEHDRKPINIAVFSAKTPQEKLKAVVETSTCYSCHKAITASPHVHGPASVWSCLSCHDTESVPLYSVKKPDTEVCFKCHTEQNNDWNTKKFIHGPVNTGKCAICHNPHASENPFQLFKPTWDLCVSCHAEKATGRHILVGYIHRGHPTRDVPDPLREGKELTCASCHNAHASNYPKLWALNVNSQFELCMKCHKDKYE
jgi:predicted CXXCH cytochrome family protein